MGKPRLGDLESEVLQGCYNNRLTQLQRLAKTRAQEMRSEGANTAETLNLKPSNLEPKLSTLNRKSRNPKP